MRGERSGGGRGKAEDGGETAECAGHSGGRTAAAAAAAKPHTAADTVSSHSHSKVNGSPTTYCCWMFAFPADFTMDLMKED